MRVRCIDNLGASMHITVGKIYEVIEKCGSQHYPKYRIVNDKSLRVSLFTKRFIRTPGMLNKNTKTI